MGKAMKPLIRFDTETVTGGVSNKILRPIVYTGEQLAGTVLVGDEIHFDEVLVTFKGSIQNTTKHAQSPMRKIHKPLIHLSYTLDRSSFRRIRKQHQCLFFFSVPQCNILPDLTKCSTFTTPCFLPPTTQQHKKRDPNRVCNDDKEGTCKVTYSVSAQLLLNGSYIDGGCSEREVILFPTSDIPPPVFIPQHNQECGKNEYQLIDRTTLKGSFKTRFRDPGKCPKVQVETSEPEAFAISPHEMHRDSSTQLHLRFSIIGGDLQSRPALRECKVDLSLRAFTFFSIDEAIQKTSDVFIMREIVGTERRKLTLESWEWRNQRWETSVVIKTLAPIRAKSLPSFSHGLLSRRLVYVVQVDLCDADRLGLSRKIELNVPIQVVLKKKEEGNLHNFREEVEPPTYIA